MSGLPLHITHRPAPRPVPPRSLCVVDLRGAQLDPSTTALLARLVLMCPTLECLELAGNGGVAHEGFGDGGAGGSGRWKLFEPVPLLELLRALTHAPRLVAIGMRSCGLGRCWRMPMDLHFRNVYLGCGLALNWFRV